MNFRECVGESCALLRESYQFLRLNKSLYIYPTLQLLFLIAAFAAIIVTASNVPAPDSEALPDFAGIGVSGAVALGLACGLGVLLNAALVGAALQGLSGRPVGLVDGWRLAWSRRGQLLAFAVALSALNMLVQLSTPLLGATLALLAASALWTVTFLAPPAILVGAGGLIAALRRVARITHKTWGVTIAGIIILSLVFFLAQIVLTFGCGLMIALLIYLGQTVAAYTIVLLTAIALFILIVMNIGVITVFCAALFLAVPDDDQAPYAGERLNPGFAPG